MGMATRARTGVPAKAAALAALGYAGGAMCITLMFLGMRSVMDIGGYCAEGGPYVIATSCPDAATPSLMLGIFGLFLFGAIATAGGLKVGGVWAAAPVLGWSALFGVLGWNFMAYGVFSVPGGGIELGWAICGIVFWVMAVVPLVAVIGGLGTLATAPADAMATRQARREAKVPYEPDPATSTIIRIVGPDGTRVVPADDPEAQEQLAAIVAAMGAALDKVEAATPALVPDDAAGAPVDMGGAPADMGGAPAEGGPSVDDAAPASSPADGDGSPAPVPADFDEGTQALLDRLERLADMRDRGLLEPAEYETAKDAIVRELEARQ
jgi:hypothetical protein